MHAFIATDIAVVSVNGRLWATEKYYTIIQRYYNSFGKFSLCSRLEKEESPPATSHEITEMVSNHIEVSSLMRMLIGGYKETIVAEIKCCDFVISRCPSISGYQVATLARKYKLPYMTENMGCPWDVYWNHSFIGRCIAPYMYFKMKEVVKHSNYALYVTKHFLQHRYPSDGYCVAASNVMIKNCADEAVINNRIKHIQSNDFKTIVLMTTSAVDVKYKGQEYVIRTIKQLNNENIRVKYLVVGEGNASRLTDIAETCGVSDQVCFTGRLQLTDVLDLLDQTDIYVQPSLTEGLPRAVIEAMSRGCVCIGTSVGGIPELIQNEYLVKPKSSQSIYEKIKKYINLSQEEKIEVAVRNITLSQEYESSILEQRRNNLFEKIKKDVRNVK